MAVCIRMPDTARSIDMITPRSTKTDRQPMLPISAVQIGPRIMAPMP